MSQDCGYGSVVRGSPLPEDIPLSPDLEKDWLALVSFGDKVRLVSSPEEEGLHGS